MDGQRFSHCDENCVTRELYDVSADPSWSPVLCVERVIGPLGHLTSVVNHRDKTFEQRRAELETVAGVQDSTVAAK